MGRRVSLWLFCTVLAAASPSAFGQADARAAFDAGKAAFTAGQFDKARDQFLAASQTDVQNAEVFLWLGKAQYELGQVDAAVAAWTTTLRLAPDEPYATKMLAALRGQLGQTDVALSLIDVLLREQLFDPALTQSNQVLADKAITDPQRVKAMTFRAEALLGLGRAKEVVPAVHEILTRYPKLADANQTVLLLARAYLHSGEKTAEALAMIRKVAADNAAGNSALVAQVELAMFDLDQGVTAERIDALAKWVAANPDHAMAAAARQRLIDADLTLARQGPAPKPDAALTKPETDALATAAEILKRSARVEDSSKLVIQFAAYMNERYGRIGANAAGSAAMDAVLAMKLSPAARLMALQNAARFKSDLAIAELTKTLTAAGGSAVKADPMPPSLAAALAVYDTIAREYPAANINAISLADRLRNLAAQLPWPPKVTELKAPLAWSVQIALGVVKSDADEAAVDQAVQIVSSVATELSNIKDPSAASLAATVHGQLLAALSWQRQPWLTAMQRQAALLSAVAIHEFNENLRLGKDDQNEKLSATQTQLLDVLAQIAARYANQAPSIVGILSNHLQPWINRGHYKLTEDAYAALAKALPADQQRHMRLAVARLWIAQADREQDRLLAAGLAPARQLDPNHNKALEALYTLQADLADNDPLLASIRATWDSIIVRYKKLEYFDIAEQAMKVKGAAAVAQADTYAQLQLVRLQEEQAWRQLDQQLKQYKAAQNLALTPAHKATVEAYAKFIADWPASPLAQQAAGSIFGIASRYEQLQAYDAAGDVYRSFIAFAAKQPALASAAPGNMSMVEQAAFSAAVALDQKAHVAFAKAQAERKPDSPPPAKVSDEFAAAINAYKDYIKTRPASPALPAAIQKIMAIALDYARVDAWDVADGIYADLGAQGLAARYPERLEFSRALCQLGKAMPDHAKQVLGALTWGTPPADAETAVAMGQPSLRPPTPPGTPGGGRARGGAGGGGAAGPAINGTDDGRPMGQAPASGHEDRLPIGDYEATLTGNGANNQPAEEYQRKADEVALATIRQQESQRANQVAMMRDQQVAQYQKQVNQSVAAAMPVLSDAELTRLDGVFDAAYKLFAAIRTKYPTSITAEQARGEMLIMVAHWRTVAQWQRAAALAGRFLADNPTDAQLPHIRLQIARDWLAYAAQPATKTLTKQEMLAEVTKRFEQAREELLKITKDFPDERDLRQQAQWDIATSLLTQARVVDTFSPTLARGQYVRAAKELQRVATQFQDHPNVASIPQMLWDIAQQLSGRGYYDEALIVWNDLMTFDPANPLAQQAAPRIAQIYQANLNRPMRAVETYLEINFSRGGSDQGIQDNIFQIGSQLKEQKRWVEALHVLETFVDSFPRHPNAGQALTMIGQIHQANEAWPDAIKAYRRVIDEFPSGAWVQEAKWSIAECTINLSQWKEAINSYESFVAAYPGDGRVAEATRRIGVIKDLDRYQNLVNEDGQRKAFDAQYQIATIVQTQLSNPTKAIIEFRKVQEKWPKSHLAAGALYQVGVIYLQMGEIDKGREALAAVGENYPDSTLADDALFALGKSYEEESQRLAGLTRGVTLELAKDIAQREAYKSVQKFRNIQSDTNSARIQELRKSGKGEAAELEQAGQAVANGFNSSNFELAADKAKNDVELLSAAQLADRQDRINAALRKAVQAYANASKVPGGDKAGDALLRMAVIYDEQLKDSKAALDTWQEIVRQFSGNAVAEEASWRIAQYYERDGKWTEAVEAYKSFLRNYRRSPKAGLAQIAIAEGYEHLGQWVNAMDAYTNYINNFADGPMVKKAQEQISWIKTYRL